jgi:hypothetical protein
MRMFAALACLFLLAACAKITDPEIAKVNEVAESLPDGCIVSESFVSPGNAGNRRHVHITVDCYGVSSNEVSVSGDQPS